MNSIDRLSVVVAHPDDEALGCAGTILKLKKAGALVQVIFLTNGVSSREGASHEEEILRRKSSCEKACTFMKIDDVVRHNFDDNALDGYRNLEITKVIEQSFEKFRPDCVFTHSFADLNIDHQVVFRSVMTAARPLPGSSVKSIFTFEVPSSTNWLHSKGDAMRFNPQHYEDITSFFEDKISVLYCYDEKEPEPHARLKQLER